VSGLDSGPLLPLFLLCVSLVSFWARVVARGAMCRERHAFRGPCGVDACKVGVGWPRSPQRERETEETAHEGRRDSHLHPPKLLHTVCQPTGVLAFLVGFPLLGFVKPAGWGNLETMRKNRTRQSLDIPTSTNAFDSAIRDARNIFVKHAFYGRPMDLDPPSLIPLYPPRSLSFLASLLLTIKLDSWYLIVPGS
jgi:hypothetical protein